MRQVKIVQPFGQPNGYNMSNNIEIEENLPFPSVKYLLPKCVQQCSMKLLHLPITGLATDFRCHAISKSNNF